MKNIKKDSFIVVSDFHSIDWPLDIIEKNYLNRFDKIYILGDATDRGEKNDGTNGLNVLIRIKDLSEKYPNRIIYIPGNHDAMLYNYAMTKSIYAKDDILRNNGSQTIKDINNLKDNNKEIYNDLINWLGSLPIQKEQYYDNQRYVLAHALFNELLFQEIPNYSLKDYSKQLLKYDDILWFRKRFEYAHDYYKKENLPDSNSIMIIGHTPVQFRKDKNLDLINKEGQTVKVYCVDGGITYGGILHKFDSNTKKVEPAINSLDGTINENEEYIEKTITPEEQLKKYILKIVMNYNDINIMIDKVLNDLNNSNLDNKIKEYINEQMLYYSIKNNTIHTNNIIKSIISEIVLDHIIDSLIQVYNSNAMAIVSLEYYLEENNINYITNKIGNARDYIMKIPKEELIKVLKELSIKEYINNKYGKILKK